jgi:hypothetical protein
MSLDAMLDIVRRTSEKADDTAKLLADFAANLDTVVIDFTTVQSAVARLLTAIDAFPELASLPEYASAEDWLRRRELIGAVAEMRGLLTCRKPHEESGQDE